MRASGNLPAMVGTPDEHQDSSRPIARARRTNAGTNCRDLKPIPPRTGENRRHLRPMRTKRTKFSGKTICCDILWHGQRSTLRTTNRIRQEFRTLWKVSPNLWGFLIAAAVVCAALAGVAFLITAVIAFWPVIVGLGVLLFLGYALVVGLTHIATGKAK